MPFPWVAAPACGENSPAGAGGHLRPKTKKGTFFLQKEGGFGAFSVSWAQSFLSGGSALKYKREKRDYRYQTFLLRFLGTSIINPPNERNIWEHQSSMKLERKLGINQKEERKLIGWNLELKKKRPLILLWFFFSQRRKAQRGARKWVYGRWGHTGQ